MGKVYIQKNRILLEEMIKIYKPDGIDWMSYLITVRNTLTFHHIDAKSKGGKSLLENGALISKRGHKDLNRLEKLDPILFDYWNQLFLCINETKQPINSFYIMESVKLKEHTKRLIYK